MFDFLKKGGAEAGSNTPRVAECDGGHNLPGRRTFRTPDLSMPYAHKVLCVRDILASIPFAQADEFLADILAPRGGITMKVLGESLVKAGEKNLRDCGHA